MKNIEVIHHSAVRLEFDKIIYFDPYKIAENINDADIIFITHNHYDHFSWEDILKLIKDDTIIVVPKSMKNEVPDLNIKKENIISVEPGKSYEILNIPFETVRSYNIGKTYHLKEDNFVGYILNIDNERYYVAGDTDLIDEIKNIKCSVAFVPVGGTFTMNYKEAATLVNLIKPKIAIPIHYGLIVGSDLDAINFKNMLDQDIECKILIKQKKEG